LDANGVPRASFVYEPFGTLLAESGLTSTHRRRFNGKESDESTTLSYYGFRYYDPSTLRWISADPLFRFAPEIGLSSPQRHNLYAFSLNSPARFYDPDGRNPLAACAQSEACQKTIGAVITVLFMDTSELADEIEEQHRFETVTEIYEGPESFPKETRLVKVSSKPMEPPRLDTMQASIEENKAAGKKWQDETGEELKAEEDVVASEVTVETEEGTTTRLDHVTKKGDRVRCVECKGSETAPLTKNQKKAFPEIEKGGAVVKGKGKPGFPGGTRIPPTRVEIKRP
jgi:RHS repeat-associated protein